MRDKISGIYCITNLVNGKKYIGRAVHLNYRLRTHKQQLEQGTHPNKHLQSSWNQYGENNFKFEVMFLCNVQDLDCAEIFFIAQLKLTNKEFGYNNKDGGQFIKNYSPRAKKNPLSEEHKEKIRKSNTGHFVSDETKEKLRKAKIGFRHTEETKQKEREMFSGSKSCMYGKKGILSTRFGHKNTPEATEKTAQARRKPVLKISLVNGEVIEKFNSVKEAWVSLGHKSGGNLSACLCGIRKQCGGYGWRYA